MGRTFRAVLSGGAALGAVVFAVAPGTGEVVAYPTPVDFDGALMRWEIAIDSAPITYEVVADREQDLALFGGLIDDAAVLWTDVPSSYFALAQAQPGETAQVTVHLDSTGGSAFSAGYAVFDTYDGNFPTHCAIHVTVDTSTSSNGLAKTVLHELGHCAGLGHTLIPEAIMSYSLDKNSFALDVDDEAALARLYPADGSKPKLPAGCAVGAWSGDARSMLSWTLLLIPALAFRASCPQGRRRRAPTTATGCR